MQTEAKNKTFQLKTNLYTFLTTLKSSEAARNTFINSIVSTGFENCYLEFPPLSTNSKFSKIPGEYTVIESKGFNRADWTIFRDKLEPFINKKLLSINSDDANVSAKQNINVTYFPNISRDTILVVPVPTQNETIDKFSGHLMAFLKNGQKDQKHKLIEKFADLALTMTKTNTSTDTGIGTGEQIYISTHGHGVPWLHIRLCKTAKYYTFSKYV